MDITPILAPGGYAPVSATTFADAGGNAALVSTATPMPVWSRGDPGGARAIDLSLTMPQGTRLIAPVDPERETLIVANPSDTAMQVATAPIALDGTPRPGAIALAPGATLTLPNAGGQVFAWCGAAGKPLSVTAIRRGRTSRRTIAASSNVGLPGVAATAGTVGTNAAAQTFFADFWVRGDADVTDVELVYLGWGYTQAAGNAETDAATAPTVAASIEYPAGSGLLHPLTFCGAATATLPIGGQLVTDALPVTLKRGAKFCVRTFVDLGAATNGFLWQLSAELTAQRPRVVTGDVTQTSGQTPLAAGFHVAPSLILGTASIDAPRAVLIAHDSINHGLSEAAMPDARNNMGWLPRLLDRVLGVPYVKVGRGGLSTANMVGGQGSALDAATVRLRRLLALLRATHAVDTLGANDLTSGTVALATLAKGRLARLFGGFTPAISRVLPRTTSTDGWTTPGGQTPVSANLAAYNALLDGAPELTLIDPGAAAAIGSSWVAGMTADGIHPTPAGAEAIATNPVVQARVRAWLGG